MRRTASSTRAATREMIATLALALALACFATFIAPQAAYAASGTLPLNGSVSGSVTDDAGSDTYTVTIPRSGRAYFSLDVADGGDIKVAFTGSWTDNYEQSSGGTLSFSERLRAGTYTISLSEGIWNGKGDTTPYTLRWTSFEACADTFPESSAFNNDSKDASVKIDVNSHVFGFVDFEDSEEWFRFKASKAGAFKLTLNDMRDCAIRSIELADAFGEIKYTESSVRSGSTYTYNIKPGTYYLRIDPKYQGTFEFASKLTPYKKAKIKKVKNVKGAAMTVKWQRRAAANGYVVQIARNAKFTKGVRTFYVNSNTISSEKIYNLAKKKYYVRVRCSYKTSSYGLNAYSPWSSVKSVAIRK